MWVTIRNFVYNADANWILCDPLHAGVLQNISRRPLSTWLINIIDKVTSPDMGQLEAGGKRCASDSILLEASCWFHTALRTDSRVHADIGLKGFHRLLRLKPLFGAKPGYTSPCRTTTVKIKCSDERKVYQSTNSNLALSFFAREVQVFGDRNVSTST